MTVAPSPSAESEQLRTWHRELLDAGLAWEHIATRELRARLAKPGTLTRVGLQKLRAAVRRRLARR